MSSRKATGTRFKIAEEKRARRSMQTARLWRLVRSAVMLVDNAKNVAKGLYEIEPAAMIALRQYCDEMRLPLKIHERELMEGSNDE